ncbi:hypothetical protein F2P81_018940 [Scophthalmus maximus]|uniref:Uncharacterized protein n=1 Tax=Scophthalmus maximus TaxID=52904 RepID=A0A6A4SBM0_SCOMX|nr:hypothetical protein F2P81_018940 [Scophthalmus maximus]
MVKRQPTMTVGSKQGIKRPVYCRTFPYFLRYLTQYITEGLSSTISRSRLHRDHQPTLSIQQSKGHTTSHNGARNAGQRERKCSPNYVLKKNKKKKEEEEEEEARDRKVKIDKRESDNSTR